MSGFSKVVAPPRVLPLSRHLPQRRKRVGRAQCITYDSFTSLEVEELSGKWPERHVLLLPPTSENSDATLACQLASKVRATLEPH